MAGAAFPAESKSRREPESLDASHEPGVALRSRLIGWFVYLVVRLLYLTLRVEFVNAAGLDTGQSGAIFVTWHGRSMIPANVFRKRGYWALISLSRDGEIQNNIFQRFGFQTVRGSTGRGGVKAALQMARKVRDGGVLAFTPDGPRGPSHKVQLGVILMAEKSGAPIIPLGISARKRWLLRSWDAYMFPRPFTRVHFVVGSPIHVPPGLNDAGRSAIAEQLEVAVNRLEREAEIRAGHDQYPWPTELRPPGSSS